MMALSPLTAARVIARHRHTVVDADEHDEGLAKGGPREQLLRARLDRIAGLARRLVERARVDPQAPASAMVAQLVNIVDEAEG